MAQVEIDEAELVGLRQLHGVFNKMMNSNPKARKLVLQAQKLVNPDAAIPEIDASNEVMDEVQKLRTEMGEFMGKIKEKETEAEKATRLASLESKWNEGRAQLRAEGYNEDGIKKIEDLMEKETIPNHRAAAAYFEKLNPQPDPIASVSNKFDFFSAKPVTDSDDKMKKLMEDPDQFANMMVGETLSEIRSGARK
jgi:hypothetical protein